MSGKALAAPLMAGAASAGAADPFYTIQDALDRDVKALRVKFDQWKAMLDSCNTATDMTFKLKHDEFQKELDKTNDRCSKLKTAVANIEKNRGKFSHVDDKELSARRELVWSLEKSVIAMKDVFLGRETRGKMDSDARKELAARTASDTAAAAAAQSSYAVANADYLRGAQQQQAQLRREQDTHLEGLSSSLTRVGEMARAIDVELREQDKLIDDTTAEVDAAQGKMDSTIKHVEKLLKTKDKCTLITIAVLVLVFIIVAIVAFYMIGR